MSQLSKLMGMGILGLVLVVGAGFSGDAKKDKEPAKESTKSKGVPTGWSKMLKLTAAQRKKISGVHEEYASKIKELEERIADLKAKERSEMVRVLTDDQRAKLLQGLTGEPVRDKAKPAIDKAKDDKK